MAASSAATSRGHPPKRGIRRTPHHSLRVIGSLDRGKTRLSERPLTPEPVLLLEALGQVADRERVPVLDPAVLRVEELEEDVRNP